MSKYDLKVITIKPEALDTFKNKWPCHGIPDEVEHIVVMMDANTGDLIDYDLCDETDNVINLEDTDTAAGVALSALFDDALANHVTVLDNPQLIGPTLEY
jgi:hypothetical protein